MKNIPEKKYRVLFPYNRGRVGGSYISSSQLARYLHEDTEFEPVIALPRRAKNRYIFEQYGLRINEHGLRVSSVPLRQRFLGGRLKIFMRWMNTFRAWWYLRVRPDFIHVHDDNSFYIWARAAKWRGIPVLWHVRQENVKAADERSYSWANHIICISDGCKSRFAQKPELSERILVIYNGIDLDEFAPVDRIEAAEVRRELGIPKSTLALGFIGNLVERKRPRWAFEVLKKLTASGTDAQLFFVGEDRGSPAYHEQFKNEKEVSSCVFMGVRSDVNRLISAFDILLVPSRPHGEPFSRVVAEGCAMGVPVIASSGVGALELLNPGEDCLCVDSEEVTEYVHAAKELCMDPKRRERMGQLASKTARDVFSYQRMGRETVELYRSLFSQ